MGVKMGNNPHFIILIKRFWCRALDLLIIIFLVKLFKDGGLGSSRGRAPQNSDYAIIVLMRNLCTQRTAYIYS